MSYLKLSDGMPDFSKAVISFWFRVPKSTLDAAADAWEGDIDKPFDGITPLVVFGDDTMKGYYISSGIGSFGSYTRESWRDNVADPPGTYHLFQTSTISYSTSFTYEPGDERPFVPCYIGIDCNRNQIDDYDPDDGLPPPKPNVLRVNIQMSNDSTASGWVANKISHTVSGSHITYAGGQWPSFAGAVRSDGAKESFGPDRYGHYTFIVPAFNPFTETRVYEDRSTVSTKAETERFNVKLDNLEITPDHWHHVLLSFDLAGKITATGAQSSSRYPEENTGDPDHGSVATECRVWVAVDDVNYEGADLRDRDEFDEYVTSRLDLGPNDLITGNAIQIALTRVPANGSTGPLAFEGYTSVQTESGYSLPTYDYTPGDIKSQDYPFALPASSMTIDDVETVDFIRAVEMAELQFFTDVTLDTGDEANRRAFVSAYDPETQTGGAPVDPNKKPTDDDPQSGSIELLGEQPAILLHGSGNWIAGKNTAMIDNPAYDPGLPTGPDNPKLIPSDRQFAPTGKIVSYTPDPSLHGPQSPEEPLTVDNPRYRRMSIHAA